MLFRWGVLAVRLRWLIIALWIVALLVAALFAPRVTSKLTVGFGQADTESERAVTLLKEQMHQPEAVFAVVFSHPTLQAADPQYRQAVESTLTPLVGYPGVLQVSTLYSSENSSLVSKDGHTSYAVVVLEGTVDHAMSLYPALREQIKPPQGFQMWTTGGIPIFSDLNTVSETDLRRAEMVSFPLVLVALAIVFGTLVAAALPIAMAILTIAITMAFTYFLAQTTDVSIFVLNIASFLGIGISIDYTLLVVNRFREELPQRPLAEAVGMTMATAGRTILFSGLTTAVGLSGMLLIPYTFFRSLGIGGVTVVIVSVLTVLTLVPAVLGVLGPRVNSLRVLPASRNRQGQGMWRRLAYGVMRHPILVALPVTLLLLVLAVPFLNVNIGTPWASVLPANSEARQGWEKVETALGPGTLTPVVMVVRAPAGVLKPETVGALYDFTHKLAQDSRVEHIDSIVTLNPSITKEQYQQMYAMPEMIPVPAVKKALAEMATADLTVVRIYPAYPIASREAKTLLKDIRSQTLGPRITTLVTGATAELEDAADLMYRYFPLTILYVVVTTYLVLLVLFRSVVLPLKAVIMNALSILASYGALVYIFQQGHFQNLLGFHSQGYTETTIPIVMFSVLFGLSMDYEVFLLSRIKEVYDETHDNTESVALGLERTGRIITSAALILVLVSAAFSTSQVIVVKGVGVGMAIAIFLDATLVRALLVPALMRVLGDWNWWAPRWLLRILPQQRIAA